MQAVDRWPAKHLQGAVSSQGKKYPADCLLDNVANVNVVSQAFAVRCGLRKVEVPLLSMEGFRGEKSYYYGAYKISMRLTDSTSVERAMEHLFYSVDLSGTDLLLGRL